MSERRLTLNDFTVIGSPSCAEYTEKRLEVVSNLA